MDESSSSDSSDKSFATARENLNSSTESFKSATSDNGCDDSDRVLLVPEGGLSPPLPRASRAAGEDDHGHHQVEDGSDETSLLQVENEDNDDGNAGEDDTSARNQVEEDNDASSMEDNDASSMEIDDEGDAEDKEDDGADSADIAAVDVATNPKRKANEMTPKSMDQRATKRCRVAPARPAAAAARRRQSRAVKKKSPLKFPPPTGDGARAAAVAASNPDPFGVRAAAAATTLAAAAAATPAATPAATSPPKPPAAPAPTPTATSTATATAATKAAPPASTATATQTAAAPTATAPTATAPAATATATPTPTAAAGGVGGSRGSGYLSSPSSAEKSQDSKECDISLDSVLGTKFIAEDSQDSDNKALSPLIIDKGQNVLKGDFGGGLSPILRVSSPPVSTPKPHTPPFGSARADQQELAQRKRKASTTASKNTRKNDVDESFATDGKRTKTDDLPPPTVATVEGTRKEGDSYDSDSLNLSESITSTNSKSQEDHEIGGDSKDGQLDHGEDSTGDDDRNSNTSSKPAKKKKSVRFSSPSDGSPWQSGRRSSASSAGLSMSFLGPSSSDPDDLASPSGVEGILNQSVHKNTMEELMQTTARRNQQAKQKVLMQQLRQSAPVKDIDYDALSSNKSPSKDDAESGKSESAISTPELNDDARSPKRMASEEKPNDSTPEKPATMPEDELQDKAAAKGENESAEFDGKKAASDEEDASAKDANHDGKTLEEDAAVVTEEDATVDNAKEDNAGDEDAHDGGDGHQEASREKRRGTKQSSPRNKTSESQTSEKPAFEQEEKGTSTPKWPDHSFPGGDIDGKIGGDSSPTAASKSTRNDDADGKHTKTVTFADDLTKKSKSQEDHEIDGVSKDGAASMEDDASKQLVEEQQNSDSGTAETESAPKKMSGPPRKDGEEKEEQVEDGTSKPREEDSSEHDNDGEKEDDTESGKSVEEQSNKSATDDDEDDAPKPRDEDASEHDGDDEAAKHGKISEELEGLEVEMPAAESSESSEEKDDAEMPAAESSESSEEKDDAEMPAAESSDKEDSVSHDTSRNSDTISKLAREKVLTTSKDIDHDALSNNNSLSKEKSTEERTEMESASTPESKARMASDDSEKDSDTSRKDETVSNASRKDEMESDALSPKRMFLDDSEKDSDTSRKDEKESASTPELNDDAPSPERMALASDNSEKDSDTSRKDEGAEEESIDLDETETPAAASSEKAIEKTAKKHSLQADILAQVEQNQAKGNTSRYLEYSSEDWKRHSGEHTKEERKAAFSADIAAEICSGSAETIRDLHLEESFNWNACNTNGESYPHLVIQECNCFAGKQAREFSHISCPHKDKLESLIVKGASARVADDSGDTLLHIACKHGSYAVIAYLLKVAPELILFKNNSGLMPFANVPESSASELYDKLKRSVLAAVTQLFQTGGWTRMNIKDVKAIDGVGRAHGDGRTCVPDNNTTCMWLLATTKGDELNPEVRERLLNLTKQEVRDRLKVGKDASGDPSLAEVQAFAASLGVHVQVPFQQDSLVYILGRSTGIFLLLVAIHFENGETDYHALHLRANHHIIHDNTKGMKAVQFTDKDIQSEASAGLMLLEAFGKGERQAGDVKSIRLVATRQFLSDKEEADLKVVKAKKAKKTKTKMDNVQIDEIYWAFKELGGQPFSDAIERQQSNFHELYKNPKEKVTKKMLTTFLETKFGLPVDGANTPNFYDCLKCEEPGIQVYVIQVHYKMDGKESSETRALVFQVSKSEYGLKKYLYNNNTSEAMRLLTEDLSTKNGVSNAFEARLPSRRDGYKYKYVRTELNWAFKFRNE